MTVKELIAKLQEMPQDAIVACNDGEATTQEVCGVEVAEADSWLPLPHVRIWSMWIKRS